MTFQHYWQLIGISFLISISKVSSMENASVWLLDTSYKDFKTCVNDQTPLFLGITDHALDIINLTSKSLSYSLTITAPHISQQRTQYLAVSPNCSAVAVFSDNQVSIISLVQKGESTPVVRDFIPIVDSAIHNILTTQLYITFFFQGDEGNDIQCQNTNRGMSGSCEGCLHDIPPSFRSSWKLFQDPTSNQKWVILSTYDGVATCKLYRYIASRTCLVSVPIPFLYEFPCTAIEHVWFSFDGSVLFTRSGRALALSISHLGECTDRGILDDQLFRWNRYHMWIEQNPTEPNEVYGLKMDAKWSLLQYQWPYLKLQTTYDFPNVSYTGNERVEPLSLMADPSRNQVYTFAHYMVGDHKKIGIGAVNTQANRVQSDNVGSINPINPFIKDGESWILDWKFRFQYKTCNYGDVAILVFQDNFWVTSINLETMEVISQWNLKLRGHKLSLSKSCKQAAVLNHGYITVINLNKTDVKIYPVCTKGNETLLWGEEEVLYFMQEDAILNTVTVNCLNLPQGDYKSQKLTNKTGVRGFFNNPNENLMYILYSSNIAIYTGVSKQERKNMCVELKKDTGIMTDVSHVLEMWLPTDGTYVYLDDGYILDSGQLQKAGHLKVIPPFESFYWLDGASNSETIFTIQDAWIVAYPFHRTMPLGGLPVPRMDDCTRFIPESIHSNTDGTTLYFFAVYIHSPGDLSLRLTPMNATELVPYDTMTRTAVETWDTCRKPSIRPIHAYQLRKRRQNSEHRMEDIKNTEVQGTWWNSSIAETTTLQPVITTGISTIADETTSVSQTMSNSQTTGIKMTTRPTTISDATTNVKTTTTPPPTTTTSTTATPTTTTPTTTTTTPTTKTTTPATTTTTTPATTTTEKTTTPTTTTTTSSTTPTVIATSTTAPGLNTMDHKTITVEPTTKGSTQSQSDINAIKKVTTLASVQYNNIKDDDNTILILASVLSVLLLIAIIWALTFTYIHVHRKRRASVKPVPFDTPANIDHLHVEKIQINVTNQADAAKLIHYFKENPIRPPETNGHVPQQNNGKTKVKLTPLKRQASDLVPLQPEVIGGDEDSAWVGFHIMADDPAFESEPDDEIPLEASSTSIPNDRMKVVEETELGYQHL